MSQDRAPATTLEHQPALDGLRALALLMVLSIHFQRATKTGLVEILLFWPTSYGWLGVDLFFVLSGYLITSILLRSRNSERYYSSFYARRFLRIFPPYWLLLGVYWGVRVLQGFKHGGFPSSPLWYFAYLQNFEMSWLGSLPDVSLRITWSLAVEEQFYLLWPVVVRSLTAKQLRTLCITGMIVALVLRVLLCYWAEQPLAAYMLMICRIDALCAGALVSLWCNTSTYGTKLPDRFRKGAYLAIGAAGLAVAAVSYRERNFTYLTPGAVSFGISASAIAFAALLVLVLKDALPLHLTRIFAWGPLCTFGRYSYAMYLVHIPIQVLLVKLLPRADTPDGLPRWFGTAWIAQLGYYVIATGVTYLAARLSWKIFERRFMALKSHFPY